MIIFAVGLYIPSLLYLSHLIQPFLVEVTQVFATDRTKAGVEVAVSIHSTTKTIFVCIFKPSF